MTTFSSGNEPPNATDQCLVEQFFAGDDAAFEQIVDRYESKVFTTALALTENTADAEAVLQEVFTTLHDKLTSDFGKTALFSWLIQHTLDTSVSRLIEQKNDQIELPSHYREKSSLNEHITAFNAQHGHLRGLLLAATRTLPEHLKLVFLLRDIQGLPLTKTAAILGLNVFEIRSRLHNARLRIRAHLTESFVALQDGVELDAGGSDSEDQICA